METKIHHYTSTLYQFVDRFRDVRFAGQIVFVGLVLLISWSGVKAIQANYGLEKQVVSLSQQINIQKLENENQQLQNNYYRSSQYLELSARQNFGLADAGEQELLVPQNVALSFTSKVPVTATKVGVSAVKQSKSQLNFETWVNFFLHRQAN
jgi:cell division protein FtsB